ncbi:MAG: ankyrin repeat domain-containing protein, partial [Thermoanaerobaculia bacterium]
LTLLVDRGAALDAVDAVGTCALHSLASRGNADGIRLLLAKGANIELQSPEGKSALHYAALGKHAGVVRMLVESGASLEISDAMGRTPLVIAAREMAGADVVRTLLDLGANVAVVDRFGDTALTLAAWRGTADVVALLLERKAQIPADPQNRKQLFDQSVSNGLDALFFRLSFEGVDLAAPTMEGGTLLGAAAEGGSAVILEALLSRGLDVNQRDGNSWTPLHFAADLGRREALELLLSKGADPRVRTVMGQSAWNIAAENGDQETMAFLAAKGVPQESPSFPLLSGEYLGQKKPGRRAERFAPGIVSSRYGLHSNVVFSPDGSEALWSVMLPTRGARYAPMRTLVSRLENGRWTYPQPAVYGGTEVADVPIFHPGGRALYDMSSRKLPDGSDTGKENIWVREKSAAGWTSAKPLDRAVNELPQHWQFSVDRAANLYFSTTIPGSVGQSDIYVSRLVKGRYQKPMNLGPSINTADMEGFPFITPDGRTLLFGRNLDIYVSYLTPEGTWTRGRRLPGINTPALELLPMLSPDGRYLFFSRNHATWWADAAIIDELRPVELARVGQKPAVEEVAGIVATGDVEKARVRFAAMRGAEARSWFADESEFVALGYRLLGERKVPEAIAVFEMATQAFPGSWNTWDSLGEACAAGGDRPAAIAHYAKSVELNPDNQNGKTALARLRAEEPAERLAIAPVTVPAGSAPVITDGMFSAGEWDDALRIAMSDTVSLHLKEHGGVVFIGVRGSAPLSVGPCDLSLALPGGEILQLHVSRQLGEIVIPASGDAPPWRFGLTSGWYANELRADGELGARLQTEGKTPFEIIRATSYPSEGIEFAIRRTKVPGQRWLMRLWATGFVDGRPAALNYPPAAVERTTDGWLELRLQ